MNCIRLFIFCSRIPFCHSFHFYLKLFFSSSSFTLIRSHKVHCCFVRRDERQNDYWCWTFTNWILLFGILVRCRFFWRPSLMHLPPFWRNYRLSCFIAVKTVMFQLSEMLPRSQRKTQPAYFVCQHKVKPKMAGERIPTRYKFCKILKKGNVKEYFIQK